MPGGMKPSKLLRADLALLLATVIWGVSFTVVKKSLAQSSPVLFICLRFWIAAVVMAAILPRSLRGITVPTLKRGAWLSVLLLGGFLFQTIGLRTTTPSRSAFITSLSVLLVPVFGYFLFRRRPTVRTMIGVAVATVGLALLTTQGIEMSFSRGDTLTLMCAVVFALHMVFLGRYVREDDFRQLLILQLAGSAAICSLALPVLETPFLVWDSRFAVYLVITGVLATGICLYLQNDAQQYTTANRTALIFSLEPLFAALFAYLLLGQMLTRREWIGGLLVVVGIIVSEWRRSGTGENRTVRAQETAGHENGNLNVG